MTPASTAKTVDGGNGTADGADTGTLMVEVRPETSLVLDAPRFGRLYSVEYGMSAI